MHCTCVLCRGNVSANANPGNDDGSSLRMTVIFIVVFVVLMCGLLVLLYFFYDYLGEHTTLSAWL
jgi:hypothetical protein